MPGVLHGTSQYIHMCLGSLVITHGTHVCKAKQKTQTQLVYSKNWFPVEKTTSKLSCHHAEVHWLNRSQVWVWGFLRRTGWGGSELAALGVYQTPQWSWSCQHWAGNKEGAADWSHVSQELGKEARTWAETQVMHGKKTSALSPERAFYHGNKTWFFLLKDCSILLKTRFCRYFVNYSSI